MDWSSVTIGELLEGLQEVDWKHPRGIVEFLQVKPFPPKSISKWTARLKNNVYYYRTNYLVLLILISSLCFFNFRTPLAVLAVMLSAVGAMCLNDPFATGFNELLLRLLRKVNTRSALKLRALAGSQDGNLGLKRRKGKRLYILWLRRGLVCLILQVAAGVILYRCQSFESTKWVVLLSFSLPLLHATFRPPNLKASLPNTKDEFRAVWRGYQANLGGVDYSR